MLRRWSHPARAGYVEGSKSPARKLFRARRIPRIRATLKVRFGRALRDVPGSHPAQAGYVEGPKVIGRAGVVVVDRGAQDFVGAKAPYSSAMR